MKTTLNQIRDKSPCTEGWQRLLSHLGKTKADDEPLSIVTVLDSNGLDDALWCLQAVKGHDREIRLFGVWCARQVQHLMTDQRSLNALDVAERFANGEATGEERAAALAAAGAAALAAAGDAAGAAAGDAAGAAQAKRLREICAECDEAVTPYGSSIVNGANTKLPAAPLWAFLTLPRGRLLKVHAEPCMYAPGYLQSNKRRWPGDTTAKTVGATA